MRKFKKIVTQRNVALALIVFGIIGIGINIILYAQEPRPPKIVSDPKSVSINSAPSSIKPSEKSVASYSVPPSDPKYITIPAIGISNTPILRLGLLKTGAISTPDNIYEAGWYDGSSLPGQTGAMFIYGHVSSWTADGIFHNLKKLVAGDSVIITRGDNTAFTYRVVSAKVYPYNNVDMTQVLAPINPSTPGLNLMTCTGQVIKGTSEFNERLVVFTSLTNG